MKDLNTPRYWRLASTPAQASVWPYLVGHVKSRGASRYHFFPEYFCPHIITKGRGKVIANGITYTIETGDMFTLWPGIEFFYHDSKKTPWEFYYFEIEGSGRQAFIERCGFSRETPVLHPRKPTRVKDIFSSMFNIMGHQGDHDEFRLLSTLYLLPLHCSYAQPENILTNSRDIVEKAETFIKSHLSTGLNVNELCEMLQINRVSLFRAFRRERNISPIQYITDQRMVHAKKLLSHSEANIKSIAQSAGFTSVQYFIKRFKEIEGITPGDFRKNHAAALREGNNGAGAYPRG